MPRKPRLSPIRRIPQLPPRTAWLAAFQDCTLLLGIMTLAFFFLRGLLLLTGIYHV